MNRYLHVHTRIFFSRMKTVGKGVPGLSWTVPGPGLPLGSYFPLRFSAQEWICQRVRVEMSGPYKKHTWTLSSGKKIYIMYMLNYTMQTQQIFRQQMYIN